MPGTPPNNYDEEPTPVTRSVNLTLEKTDNGATPIAGGAAFDYTLTVRNLGPSDTSVPATVTDVLPAGFVLWRRRRPSTRQATLHRSGGGDVVHVHHPAVRPPGG